MKKIYQLLPILASLIVTFQLQSCKKDFDCNDLDDLKICSIKKLVIYRTSYNDVAVFSYNSHGNPTSVNVTNVATGNPNYVFKYDAWHRLSQFIGVYNNGKFENWKKFTYGAVNRVIVDTTFTFGDYNGGAFPSNYFSKIINHYFYDAQGRIIQVTSSYLLPIGNPPFSK